MFCLLHVCIFLAWSEFIWCVGISFWFSLSAISTVSLSYLCHASSILVMLEKIFLIDQTQFDLLHDVLICWTTEKRTLSYMLSAQKAKRLEHVFLWRVDSPMGNSTAIALACSGARNNVKLRSGARKHKVKWPCIRPFSSLYHLVSQLQILG